VANGHEGLCTRGELGELGKMHCVWRLWWVVGGVRVNYVDRIARSWPKTACRTQNHAILVGLRGTRKYYNVKNIIIIKKRSYLLLCTCRVAQQPLQLREKGKSPAQAMLTPTNALVSRSKETERARKEGVWCVCVGGGGGRPRPREIMRGRKRAQVVADNTRRLP
jgi:hypothetical protein